MAGFEKLEGLMDYKKITNCCFYAEIDLADSKPDGQERNISVINVLFRFWFFGILAFADDLSVFTKVPPNTNFFAHVVM